MARHLYTYIYIYICIYISTYYNIRIACVMVVGSSTVRQVIPGRPRCIRPPSSVGPGVLNGSVARARCSNIGSGFGEQWFALQLVSPCLYTSSFLSSTPRQGTAARSSLQRWRLLPKLAPQPCVALGVLRWGEPLFYFEVTLPHEFKTQRETVATRLRFRFGLDLSSLIG